MRHGHGQDHADQRGHDLHGGALLRVVLGAHLEHLAARCGYTPGALRQRHRHECARDVLDRRLAAVDEQLRERPVADQAAPLEIRGNVDADRHLAGTQAAPQIADGGGVFAYAHDSGRLHVRDERTRHRRSRFVDHCGAEAAHVEVDRVAEQQHLQQRNADDHAERQPVAPQLADLLGGDGEDARRDHATARPAGELIVVGFEARGGDEHVFETGSHALDLALHPMLLEQRADAAFRIGTLRIEQGVQAIAELRDALHEVLAVERAARGAHVVGFDLDHDRVDGIHELPRRALRHEAPAIEDGEAVASLRFVHVVRRHQDRGAAVDQLEQAFPEIATALRIDCTGRLVEQQQLGLVQRGGRKREPLLLSAAHRSRALLAPVFQMVLAQPLLDARGAHACRRGRRCAR